MLLEPNAAVLGLPGGARVSLADGNPNLEIVAEDPTGGVSHYLRG